MKWLMRVIRKGVKELGDVTPFHCCSNLRRIGFGAAGGIGPLWDSAVISCHPVDSLQPTRPTEEIRTFSEDTFILRKANSVCFHRDD